VSLSRLISLALATSRWLQDDQSGRRLPRSGFRSHRTGGDSGENKELKKKKTNEKEVARATPGHRWSSPKEICVPSSPSRLDRDHSYCPSRIPRVYPSPWSHEFRRRLRAALLFGEGDRNPGLYHRVLSKTGFRWTDDNVCEWSLRIARLRKEGDCSCDGQGVSYMSIRFYLCKTIMSESSFILCERLKYLNTLKTY